MTETYRVEWSMVVDADDEQDAANQAWILLEETVKTGVGATVLIVSGRYGENKKYIDMDISLLQGLEGWLPEDDEPEVPSGGPD